MAYLEYCSYCEAQIIGLLEIIDLLRIMQYDSL